MNLMDKLYNIREPRLKQIGKGAATTVEDFWNDFVEPLLPDKDVVRRWNEFLNEYVESSEPMYAIRGYNSMSSYLDLRRGFLTKTNDDYSFFYTDNYFAAYFCKMAIDGYVPQLDEFIDAFKNRKFPSRFGQYTSEEKELMAIPQGKDPYIQNSGYKIAHIIPVGKNYDYNGEVINITDILKRFFPAGQRSDWVLKTDSNGDYYERDLAVDPIAKKYMVAHFLRFVHPFNYFLAPKKKLEDNIVCKEIAEYPGLLEYAKYKMHLKYGALYDDYLKLIMANDLSFTNETASTVIDIKWNSESSDEIKIKAKRPVPYSKKIIKKTSNPIYSKKDIQAMAFEFLSNPNTSYRKLEEKYLNIDSAARGGGFVSRKILNDLGILSKHKGILEKIL